MGQDIMKGKVRTTLNCFLQETESKHGFMLKPNFSFTVFEKVMFEAV